MEAAHQADIEDITGRSESNTIKAEMRIADRLRSIVDRVERLNEERKGLNGDIKDIFTEAKSAGLDVKVLKALIRERAQEPADLVELMPLLDSYRWAMNA